ncbi:MAG TPA: hypothetical protein VFZ65_06095 [Planctomycetota bacterium]|nr:hypothetical protein [Planctomycetota bacterium]
MRRPGFLAVRLLLLASSAITAAPPAAAQAPPVPKIDGPWWQIAHNPDLGDLGSAVQQPVDFTIWQAADGTWQLWSCIRHTNCGGATRLFHRWQGRLTDPDWHPMGVAMQANPLLGEIPGGLQAPHVLRANGIYHMVYGDWLRICLATSVDGKVFTRFVNANGQPDLFTGPYLGTRDPMLLRIGDLYHCYYMGSLPGASYESAIFCRTSADLAHWSESMMVSAGGAASSPATPFDAECPFVLERNGWYYLFRNQVYGPNAQNTQYASRNPMCFGVGDDRYRIGTMPVAAAEVVFDNGQYYLAALTPGLDGVRIARLRWQSQ